MKARFAIILSIIAGGVILIGLLFTTRPTYLGPQTLTDGTVLTLVQVKAGHKHETPFATLRQRLAALLPARWRTWIKVSPPASTYCEYSSSNYLSVWLMAERTNGGGPPKFRLLVGDDRENFSISAEHHGRVVSEQLSSNVWLEGLPVASWPRRAKTICIQVFAEHDGKMLAEFRVKNPGRDTVTPAWTAPPWPITVRDGDFDFTLTSLWLGLGSLQGYSDARLWALKDPSQRSTRATFRVTRGGDVLTNWNAYHVRTILDATGNWSDGNGFNSLIRDGETMNQFSRPPPPADEAWRMTVEFSRVSGFSAEERYIVTGIPVPPAGESWRAATNAFGQDLLEIAWERRPTDSMPFGFWATVQPVRRDHKLTLLSATDNLGRDVPSKSSGGGASVTYEVLTLSSNATSVNLAFAFHRSRLVTFQVKPAFYEPPQQ